MSALRWLSNVQWHHPAGWWLAAVPLVYGLLAGLRRRRELQYAEAPLRAWAIRDERAGGLRVSALIRILVRLAAWALLAAALAGPRLEQLHEKAGVGRDLSRTGVSLMVVVQVPFQDDGPVAQGYLQRVWTELQDLGARLHGERLGLVAYNGRAGVLVTPTSDLAAFRFYLRRAGRVLAGRRGDALGTALLQAHAALAGARARGHSGGIILVAAGGPAPDPAVLGAALERLRAARIPVYALDMNAFAAGLLARHPHSRAFDVPAFGDRASTLAPASRWLHEVVRGTGGVYARVEDGNGDWRRLYDNGAAQLPAGPAGAGARGLVRSWRELYAWPLVPALALLLLDAGLLERGLAGVVGVRRRRRASSGQMAAVAVLALAAVGMGWPSPVSAAGKHQPRAVPGPAVRPAAVPVRADPRYAAAYAAYAAHHYALAQFRFATLAGYEARLGEGASAYRRGDYRRAARQFTAALLAADAARDRATALFDLGNVRFRLQDYRRAIEAYEGALGYGGGGQEGRIRANLWLAQAALVRQVRRPHSLAGDSGLPARRAEPPKGFPDETPPNISSVPEGPRSALAKRIARGELSAAPDETGDHGAGPAPGALVETGDASVLKLLELVRDHTSALLRGVIRHTPPPAGLPADPVQGDTP